MTVWMVKTEVLREMFKDESWSRKFDNAKTGQERATVVAEYVRAQGGKVKVVQIEKPNH